MEIGLSSSFLTQEDCTHFLNLFQDMDGGLNTTNPCKRKRMESSGTEFYELEEEKKINNNSLLTEAMLSSLFFMDNDGGGTNQNWVFEERDDKAFWDTNQQMGVSGSEFGSVFGQLQENFRDADEVFEEKPKRAKKENSGGSAGGSSGATPQQRRLWVKDRSKAWWDQCNHPDFPDSEFRRAFRMSKATFNIICEELDSVVMKKNTMLRDAIPVRQRVAVCIWRLATGEPLRLVSKRFGLGISTCHKLVLEVCAAIKNVLLPKYIRWPDEQRLNAIKNEFESSSGIHNIGGSLYTTHIPIIAPKVRVAAYYNKRHTERNQKTSYSITVQGVVDPKGVFTDICVGMPGSMTDDMVLERSILYKNANEGHLKDVWVVGNSGHPLLDWVLVPYTRQNLTWAQHGFNEKLGGVQKVAKDAFSRLKGRWACLQRRTEMKLEDLPGVLGACCVLHNICEMENEEMDPDFNFENFDDEMVLENGVRSLRSSNARDQIAHRLLHHGP